MLIEANPSILQVKKQTKRLDRGQNPQHRTLHESPPGHAPGAGRRKQPGPCNQKILVLLIRGCPGQGKPKLTVCRRHDLLALIGCPGATFHKGQNILEGKGMVTSLWPSLNSCMSYKPKLSSLLAVPRQRSHSRERREMNADEIIQCKALTRAGPITQ